MSTPAGIAHLSICPRQYPATTYSGGCTKTRLAMGLRFARHYLPDDPTTASIPRSACEVAEHRTWLPRVTTLLTTRTLTRLKTRDRTRSGSGKSIPRHRRELRKCPRVVTHLRFTEPEELDRPPMPSELDP